MGMGGIGSSESNSVEQTFTNAQATTQTGNVVGATSGSRLGGGSQFGVGAAGTSGNKIRGGGKNSQTTVNITNTSSDAAVVMAALDSNHSTTLAALEANQNLSNQSIGLANANAMEAFDVLRQLGTQAQVAGAGGSAGDILNAQGNSLTGTASTTVNNKVIFGAIAAIVVVATVIVLLKRH